MKAGFRVVALVEDDPLVRVPMAQGLDAAGFIVIGAASGPEGLEVLGDPGIDVAVIDIKLPGRLSGIAVIQEARRRNPHLKVIVISGKAPDGVSDLGVFLPKPFRLAELVALINRMLKPPSSSGRPPPTSRQRSQPHSP